MSQEIFTFDRLLELNRTMKRRLNLIESKHPYFMIVPGKRVEPTVVSWPRFEMFDTKYTTQDERDKKRMFAYQGHHLNRVEAEVALGFDAIPYYAEADDLEIRIMLEAAQSGPALKFANAYLLGGNYTGGCLHPQSYGVPIQFFKIPDEDFNSVSLEKHPESIETAKKHFMKVHNYPI